MRKISKTCLAFLRDEKKRLWFAGDRRISWGMDQAIKAPRPKITKRNGILLAGTGASCICDLVTDLFPIPDFEGGDTFEYIQTTFVPELIDWLVDQKWVKKGERRLSTKNDIYIPEDSESWLTASIIIGIGPDLYELELSDEYIAADAIDAPYAAGCGGHLAWGSLLTSENLKLNPRKRLQIALKAAAKVSPGCDDNIDILHN